MGCSKCGDVCMCDECLAKLEAEQAAQTARLAEKQDHENSIGWADPAMAD